MKTTQPKRALIATHHLFGYAGSEVFTLELATELRGMGWEVLVAALLSGEPMVSEFKKHEFRIVDILTEHSPIRNAKFDLVWIHHAPVFYQLFMAHRIEAAVVVFCSLSHFEPLESVPEYRENIDFLLANSIENANFITKDLGLNQDQVIVFPNAVPSIYWGSLKEFHSLVLRRIAVISNHPPPELLGATTLLKRNGIDVIDIGIGGTQMLMTPSLLLNCDAVITIGKTVPYCFALKIPVYCYDHFGGPGWLNETNFDLASRNNFSGRGFSTKTPEAIVHEIVNGYRESLRKLDGYMNHATNSLNLRKNLELLLTRSEPSLTEHLSFTINRQISIHHAQYIRLVQILSSRESEIVASHKEISRVKTTFSWRLTAPFRTAYNLIHRIWVFFII